MKNYIIALKIKPKKLLKSGNPPKCACCREKHYEFLTIDHIRGGRTKHKREMMNKYDGGLYGFLVKTRKKPAQYQVLCQNCNVAKYHYGKCPHQTVKK